MKSDTDPDTALTFLIVVIAFLIVLLVYRLVINGMEKYSEYFGSSCLDLFNYEKTPIYPEKKGTIFVSIASYRDTECKDTVKGIFLKSKHPEKVFLGICEQNMKPDEACYIDKNDKNIEDIYHHEISFGDWVKTNVKYNNMASYKDAKGPTKARYYCSKLWSGEEYFFQIDSHTFFEKDWDINIIKMLEQCRYSETVTDIHPYGKEGSKKPILSAYPATDDQLKIDGFPVMNDYKLYEVNKLPIFLAGFWGISSDKPIRSPKPFVAAGFMFLDGKFLNEIQYDPNLSNLFQGEEVLKSARLFTHGYDVFAPNLKVCSHHYSREGPLFFTDIPNNSECRTQAETRVRFLLGVSNKNSVAEEFLKDIDKYGLGKFRTLEDYWLASGIGIDKNGDSKKLIDGSNRWNEDTDVPEPYKYWNFNQSAYKKIKQYMD